jgi:hypothetical protein
MLWNGDTRTITIQRKDTVVELTVDSHTAFVNGQAIELEQAPFIRNGSTFVPLRFISEAIGAKVGWDELNQVATIDVAPVEPEDPMAAVRAERIIMQAAEDQRIAEEKKNSVDKLAADQQARVDGLKHIESLAAKYNLTLSLRNDYPGTTPYFIQSYYDLVDRRGKVIGDFMLPFFIGDSSLLLKGVSIPLDSSLLSFFQEVASYCIAAKSSGTTLPKLSDNLTSSIANARASENQERYMEVKVGTSFEGTPLHVRVVFTNASNTAANISFDSNYTGMSGPNIR